MNKDAQRNALGIAIILLFFGYSVWHVLLRPQTRSTDEEGQMTLRIGHWLMHAGMRESFDEAAREYERLHPGVRVEQIAVPIRSWSAWVRTQLIGGTAPDITGQLGLDEELLSRHFIPLDERLDAPNPYNQDGPLEGVPWRDTFNDGLAAIRNHTPNSGELTGIYLQLNSLRLFYNKRLLRLVTGSDTPPETYAQLRLLREQVDRYNAAHGTRLEPIAGCGPYSQYFFQRLLPSQTQKLTASLSPLRNLNVPPSDLAAFILAGRIDYRTRELHDSLALLRDVSALQSPGFTQLRRDDALFSYLQQHAVAIVAGSWDYGVFVRDGDFETGVIRIPFPDRGDPLFGHNVLGIPAEGGGGPEGAMGVVRNSRHPDIALDFLRFLTSQRVATRFTEESKRISAIVGVPPPADSPGLAPQLEGEAPGFNVDFQNLGAGHTFTLFQRHLHTLIGPSGGVEPFLAAFERDLHSALRRDLATHIARADRDAQNLDARIGFLLSLPESHADPAELERLLEVRTVRHAEHLRHRRTLQP
jgi:multiple sugar transport system substrate-binding protein/raffinose/stachyose/melibiose transport system substrate-binding protein